MGNSNDNEEKPEISYSSLWKSIIRPPRETYDIDDLGDNTFTFHKKLYERTDYTLVNKEGNIIQCSILQRPIDLREEYIMPVVIYLHGNSSSKLEGLKNCQELLKRDINIFTFDFSGCGKSEGEYITLGWKERDDVRTVVDFVEKLPGVGNIGLWGRSMGAATAMMYAGTDSRIKAICLDSPFGDFEKLAYELCKKIMKLPEFIFKPTFAIVKNTVKNKTGVDLDLLKPENFADKSKVPMFFIHAMNDELINYQQTVKMYEDYKGPKTLNIVEGGHNSVRQKHISEKIGKFYKKYLNINYDNFDPDNIEITLNNV